MKNFAGFSISKIKKEKKTVCFSCRASNYNLLLIFTCLFSKERERNRDKSLNYRFFFAINNKKRSLVCALFCCKVRRKGMVICEASSQQWPEIVMRSWPQWTSTWFMVSVNFNSYATWPELSSFLFCFWTRKYIYCTSVTCVWFLSTYVSLQSKWAWKP